MSDALRDLGRIWYSPNAAILRIRSNPRLYVALAVAVFVLPAVFTAAHTSFQQLEGDFAGFGDALTPEQVAVTSATGRITSIVGIVTIYFVGGRIGTKSSFEKIFCTMSYALMTALVAGLITTGYSFLSSPAASADGVGMMQVWNLQFVLMDLGYMALPFLIWSLVIMTKAVKQTNYVVTVRAIGSSPLRLEPVLLRV